MVWIKGCQICYLLITGTDVPVIAFKPWPTNRAKVKTPNHICDIGTSYPKCLRTETLSVLERKLAFNFFLDFMPHKVVGTR